MEYRGYLAKVEVEEGMLHGYVVNSGPYSIATFVAKDVDTLQEEFERSIDEYLLSCEEDGVDPRRPFSGKLNVRLGPTLHQQVAIAAAAQGVSINTFISQAVTVSLTATAEPRGVGR